MFALWIEEDGRFMFSPEDNGGVNITEKEHSDLFDGQSLGRRIIPGKDGNPVLSDSLE